MGNCEEQLTSTDSRPTVGGGELFFTITIKCDHSNESYRAILSYGTVYHAVQGGSNF